MRTVLTRILSAALIATSALSVAAAPTYELKVGDSPRGITARAQAATEKFIDMPRVRTAKPAVGQPGFRTAKTSYTPVAKVPFKASASMPMLRGSVIYSDTWGTSAEYGLYDIPTSSSKTFELVFDGPDASYGGVLVDDTYWTVEYQDILGIIQIITITGYDAESGDIVATYSGAPDQMAASGITYDSTTGKVYAITNKASGSGYQFATIEFGATSATTTAIASLSEPFNTIAAANDGTIYGITKVGDLVKFNKADGTYTTIGSTGMVPYYISNATIDQKTNRMFWAVSPADDSGILAEVDLKTGKATLLYAFPDNEEVTGMYAIVTPDDGAPAAPTGLTLSYPKGSLSGKIEFMAPATNYDGKAATGDLTYTLVCNGQVISTGPTVYGGRVVVDYTVPGAGLYKFQAYCSNAKGNGDKAKAEMYIGNGIPVNTTVSLEYVGERMCLEWTPVTTTENGGYIDPAKVTYNVYDAAGTLLESGIKQTTWAERITEPTTLTSYQYGVTAVFETLESGKAMSNVITLGAIQLPYTNDFSSASSLDGWTIIDSNADAKTWAYYSGTLRYSYNLSSDADDWAITPRIELKKGNIYRVTFEAYSYSANYPERIEVMYGTDNTAAAMTKVAVEPTVVAVPSASRMTLTGLIMPEADGYYYVGFHAISDKDEWYLYVDNVNIEYASSTAVPEAVNDLEVVPDKTGALNALVTFTSPKHTVAGKTLTDITDVKVYRNGAEIEVKDFSLLAGASFSFTDVVPAAGLYTYKVVVFNAEGEGLPASKTVYIGVNYPAAPGEITIEELPTPGEVTVHWPYVTETIEGNPLTESQVTYTLVDVFNGTTLYKGTDNFYSYVVCPEGEQDFVQYTVTATTDRGDGEATLSAFIPVGTPYAGLMESFPEGSLNYIWGLRGIDGGTVSLLNDASGISAQDGDNGMVAINGQYIDSGADFFSGNISLAGMTKPYLTFFTYSIADDDVNTIAVGVKEVGAADFTTMLPATAVNKLAPAEGWGLVKIDLSAYAGKNIQFQITGLVKKYIYIPIDNIRVYQPANNDLAAAISAPETVNAGDTFTVTVNVTNEGLNTESSYNVELFADGQVVETVAGPAVNFLDTKTVNFTVNMPLKATAAVTYKAEVVVATDENKANNVTAEVKVNPFTSAMPVVTDLAGDQGDGGIQLTWSEPNTKNATAVQITEDFEDAAAWAAEVGSWTFVDQDKKNGIALVSGLDFPGNGTPGSFVVWDLNDVNITKNPLAALSGKNVLASIGNGDGSKSDDWAISPALSGERQIISFYAISWNTLGAGPNLESFEVLYSTTDNKVASFTNVVEKYTNLAPTWTKFEYIIPAGAKYFAIHCISENANIFMVDDVTFTPAVNAADLVIKGYNVYRDGEKINTALVTEKTYLDKTGVDGKKYTYNVTVVYAKTTSGASNDCKIVYSELEEVAADNLAITTENGAIVVTGAEGALVTVVAVDGKTLYNAVGDARVEVLPGVYVVKAGEKVAKVLVK